MSLSDLVGYYTSCSDLLKRERLITPIPPPEPVNDKKRVVAILPYAKMPDTDELTFQKGDIFFVHNDMGDGKTRALDNHFLMRSNCVLICILQLRLNFKRLALGHSASNR